MKSFLKQPLALLLAAVMLMAALPFSAAAAGTPQPFAVVATSNLFPGSGAVYADVNELRDENGDIFITVNYKMTAHDMYLINLSVSMTWDPAVLEFKEAYNKFGSGRSAAFSIFRFAVEQSRGTGVMNTFGDSNCGRALGNYSGVSPAAYADEEDGSAITVVRAVFKLIDPTARRTAVNCEMDTLSLCDSSIKDPYAQQVVMDNFVINSEAYALGTYETALSPAAAPIGDIGGDGEMTIEDATALQGVLSEFAALDLTDEKILLQADFDGDGKVNIKDVTAMQRRLAELE